MKHKKLCPICKSEFDTSWGHQITCSEGCRNERQVISTGRYAKGLKIPSSTVGAISELLVASDLMKKGYAVFRAISPACFCDLIAQKDETTLYLEVRTGYESPISKKIAFAKVIQKGATHFAVHERNKNTTYYYDKKLKKIDL